MTESDTIMPCWESFTKSLEKASCDGITHFINAPNKILKIFWVVIFMASFGSLLYFTITRLQDFLSATVTTSFVNTDVDSLELPTITICSLNTYDDTNMVYFLFELKEELRRTFINLRDVIVDITSPVTVPDLYSMNSHILLCNFLIDFIHFKGFWTVSCLISS